MSPIISISGLTKTYADGLVALSGIDLEIRKGPPKHAEESPDRTGPPRHVLVREVGDIVRSEELAHGIQVSAGDERRAGGVDLRSESPGHAHSLYGSAESRGTAARVSSRREAAGARSGLFDSSLSGANMVAQPAERLDHEMMQLGHLRQAEISHQLRRW